MFAEFRAGQFGYNFGLVSNTTDTRYESLDRNQVLGGGRDWLQKRRRNQYTGAVSFFKDNFLGGSHNLKIGGEYLDETGNIIWNQGYADNVIQFVRGDLTGPLSAVTPDSVRPLLQLGQQERAGDDQLLHHRLVARQPADHERRPPLRPLQRRAAGAVAAGRPLHRRRRISRSARAS